MLKIVSLDFRNEHEISWASVGADLSAQGEWIRPYTHDSLAILFHARSLVAFRGIKTPKP